MERCTWVLALVLVFHASMGNGAIMVRRRMTYRGGSMPTYHRTAGHDMHYDNGRHQTMPGYGSSGYGDMYNNHGHMDNGHYSHGGQCTCRLGERCQQDKYGHSYCAPDPHIHHAPHSYGGKGGHSRCMYLDYPTSCLRPSIPGAVERFAYQHGRCMPIVASGVASWCRPRGVHNNIFASHYACEKYCNY